jgi:hypothetical protein
MGPENQSSEVNDLFDNEGFGLLLSEWQRTRTHADRASSRLSSYVASWYENDRDLSPNDVDEHVSWVLEQQPEEFEANQWHDERAVSYSQQRTSTQAAEDTAKEVLLGYSEEQGASQFALYGLWLHMRESGYIPATQLKEQAVSAEKDLVKVDEFVRRNSGNLLTVISHGVYAARLGEGGISMDGHESVIFPKAAGSIVCGAALTLDMPKIYNPVAESLNVDASDIHSILRGDRAKILEDWSELLNLESWWRAIGGNALFVPGEVTEGPLNTAVEENRRYDSEVDEENDRRYYETIFDRIRTVGLIAATSIPS